MIKEGFVIPQHLLGTVGATLLKYKLAGMDFDDAVAKIESDLYQQISQMVVDIYRQEWDRL